MTQILCLVYQYLIIAFPLLNHLNYDGLVIGTMKFDCRFLKQNC